MPDRSSISDNSGTALVTAQAQLQLVRMQNSNPSTSCSATPICARGVSRYMQAKAVLDDAQRTSI